MIHPEATSAGSVDGTQTVKSLVLHSVYEDDDDGRREARKTTSTPRSRTSEGGPRSTSCRTMGNLKNEASRSYRSTSGPVQELQGVQRPNSSGRGRFDTGDAIMAHECCAGAFVVCPARGAAQRFQSRPRRISTANFVSKKI